MTLQERLRAQARWVPVKRWVGRNAEVSKIIPKLEEEAADALDAQEKRIKELEGALRGWMDASDAFDEALKRDGASLKEAQSLRHAMDRAREALK